jgi:hypothetical protein
MTGVHIESYTIPMLSYVCLHQRWCPLPLPEFWSSQGLYKPPVCHTTSM